MKLQQYHLKNLHDNSGANILDNDDESIVGRANLKRIRLMANQFFENFPKIQYELSDGKRVFIKDFFRKSKIEQECS